MSLSIGIDTSNYTTSLSLICDSEVVENVRRLLPVAENARGLRQSDALFHHTQALPALAEELFSSSYYHKDELCAVGVSSRPRDAEGSYMPCFLAGMSFASALAFSHRIPLYSFSHQQGHIEAAVYSSGKAERFNGDFLSFHVSGGTTEIVRCTRAEDGHIECTPIGGTDDLNAGQAIDRTGVRLGLAFPCGKALDALSQESERHDKKIRVSVNGTHCSLSGLENKTNAMIAAGEKPADIAAFLFDYLSACLGKLTEHLREEYPTLPILYAGGVMSNTRIRASLGGNENVCFASPALSSDNACGIGLLAYHAHFSEKS